MQFGKSTKAFYFSVTYSSEVGQMRCVPQVCYKVTGDIRAAVEKMEKDGLARIYQEEVRFISGAPVPVKKPGITQEISSAPIESGTATKTGLNKTGKNGGRRGKDFD